jgi:hypothetical protein
MLWGEWLTKCSINFSLSTVGKDQQEPTEEPDKLKHIGHTRVA